MVTNLEARTLDSASIIISEYNLAKCRSENDTPMSVKSAIKSGKAGEISPIVVLKNPFNSVEETIEEYQKFIQEFPREGPGQERFHYKQEEKVLREILEQNSLLCYNGNIRLEEFQKAGISIRAFVITSKEEYRQMPEQERRVPKRLKSERPTQYRIDQDYVLSYLAILDDVVLLKARELHYDSFNAEKELASQRARKAKK